MSAISWDETTPADNSNASSADDEFRSMLTAIATGLGEGMYWPGSAATQGASTASSGELRAGTARAAVGASAPTGGHPDGFLALDVNNEQIWHVGSSPTASEATFVIGHGRMLDRNGGLDTVPFTTRWLIQTGTVASSDRTDSVTFTTAYNGIPTVMIGPGAQMREFEFGLKNITATGFDSNKSYVGSGSTPAGATINWRSEGTVNI